MATKKQKQVERMYLEIVRSQVNDFPTEPIRDGLEPPDFLVVSMRDILAIEITRIYRDTDPGSPPPKSQDAERDLVVERAQALAEDRSVPPCLSMCTLLRGSRSEDATVIRLPSHLLISLPLDCQRQMNA